MVKEILHSLLPTAMQIRTENLPNVTSYGASTLTFLGGAWTKNELMALAGVIFAGLTWLTSLHFARRRDRREAELHALKLHAQLAAREQARIDSGTADGN